MGKSDSARLRVKSSGFRFELVAREEFVSAEYPKLLATLGGIARELLVIRVEELSAIARPHKARSQSLIERCSNSSTSSTVLAIWAKRGHFGCKWQWTEKAEQGHDENIDMKRYAQILGDEIANRVRKLSLQIYSRGHEHAAQKGIIVADTKFEFGMVSGELLLIHECLTPDSSQFWPKDEYVVGQSPPSFDKQFVRDYLETLDWDKTPPAPRLPKDVIEKTSAKYLEAFRRLTGSELATA